MQFPVPICKYLKVDPSGFIICSGKTINKQIHSQYANEGLKMFSSIVNEMGANSAKSQGLKQIITSMLKLQGIEHRIYIKVEGNTAIGFMRSGEKKLFYHDNIGSLKELIPTCVLDIYVHESYQRSGIGKQIFEKFLQSEGKTPEKLAYDRPSPKLISFLKKHYGLVKFIPQNNNFVIYDRYFTSSNGTQTASGSSLKKLPISSTMSTTKQTNLCEDPNPNKPLSVQHMNRYVDNTTRNQQKLQYQKVVVGSRNRNRDRVNDVKQQQKVVHKETTKQVSSNRIQPLLRVRTANYKNTQQQQQQKCQQIEIEEKNIKKDVNYKKDDDKDLHEDSITQLKRQIYNSGGHSSRGQQQSTKITGTQQATNSLNKTTMNVYDGSNTNNNMLSQNVIRNGNNINSIKAPLGGSKVQSSLPLSSNSTLSSVLGGYSCPWATQNSIGFRTTSGNYGSHYAQQPRQRTSLRK